MYLSWQANIRILREVAVTTKWPAEHAYGGRERRSELSPARDELEAANVGTQPACTVW
jgi:hypothetical protein